MISIIILVTVIGGIEVYANMWFEQKDFCNFQDELLLQSVDEDIKNELCEETLEIQFTKTETSSHSGLINVNSHGFRGPEITQHKQENTYRIFAVGGSTTFGYTLLDNQTWPYFLQEKFDNTTLNFDVEVINAGILGANSEVEVVLIKERLVNFEPDLILVQDGWNEVTVNTPPEIWKNRWVETCEFGQLYGYKTIISLQSFLGVGDKQFSKEEFEAWKYYQARNTPLIKSLKHFMTPLHELNQYCTKAVDFTNVFDDVEETVYLDRGHVNSRGNKIIAEKYYNLILPIISKDNIRTTYNDNQENFINDEESQLEFDNVFTDIIDHYKTPKLFFMFMQKQMSNEFDDLNDGVNILKKDFEGEDLRNAEFFNAILTNANFKGANLSGASFQFSDLSNANFESANLTDTNLSGTNLYKIDLSGAIISNINLMYANLSHTNLSDKDFTDTKLVGVDFSYSDLTGVDFAGKDLTGSNLSHTNLSDKDFTDTKLVGVDFSYSDLTGVDFAGMDLSRSTFSHTSLENKDLTGVNFFGTNLSHTELSHVDLTETNLVRASLVNSNFFNATLSNTNLSGKDLSRSNLNLADLSNANLSFTNLEDTLFAYANLSGADLSGSKLNSTFFTFADFSNANLSGATIVTTKILDAVFQDAAHIAYLSIPQATTEIHKLFRENNAFTERIIAYNVIDDDLYVQFQLVVYFVNANFENADLTNIDFKESALIGADLTNANLLNSNLENAVLVNATVDCLNNTICN